MNRLIASRLVHRGRILELEVRTYGDDAGREWDREVIHHPGAVVVLPLLEPDVLLLIRNERVAVGERLWELPAGTLEPGEPPETSAARELEEETGFRAGRITRLGAFFTSPGFIDERIHAYTAEDLVATAQALDDGEDIVVERVAVGEALAMIDDGRLCDAKSIAAILMWQRKLTNAATPTGDASP